MSLKNSRQVISIEPNKTIDIDEVDFYWDVHLTEKDQMGESVPHIYLIHYLMDVIERLLQSQKHIVLGNFSIYTSDEPDATNYPLEPDITVFKGIELTESERQSLRSWKIGSPSANKRENRPPPNVVFEFASRKTWKADLETKPGEYALMGGQEYFAYDPNTPQLFNIKPLRLKGWHLVNGQAVDIMANDQGWLWSNELDSYLVPDGNMLRLYDRGGNMRLTEAEAERLAKEEERLAKEKAWAKLREMGIDPANL